VPEKLSASRVSRKPAESAVPAPDASERSRLPAEIGAIVRRARAKRGMTRKTLASLSRTSERYLAQIESGEGNPTVLVLECIARGLGLTLFDLLPLDEGEQSRVRLAKRLARLTDEEVQVLLRGLDTSDSATGTVRARRVSLIGLRGAGKSTLGAALADRLGCPFIELDKLVERERGANVSMLFEVYGQSTFRRYEREALEKIAATHEAAVIATAGGIVADDDTYSALRAATHVVWLKASPAEHMQRVMEQGDFRPMARNREAMKDLVAILDAREAEYGRAHAQIDTSGRSVAECADELAATVARLFASNRI
jgi:XRE family transcriptional regulator, aerobic/anaerobic benzoate catabolism transcriptional regulator